MRFSRGLVGLVMLLVVAPALVWAKGDGQSRITLSADADWRFHLGDVSGAEATAYSDQAWRKLDLPHDWSIEGKPEKDSVGGGGEGFYAGGLGWYRKTFAAPAAWAGRLVRVEFDGVYRDATVYLNGEKVGSQRYGYTSFSVDLTKGLKVGGENLLAVRVDNSAQPNSRWYSGSGIYRHVRFVVTQPEHVAQWGVFVTTPEVTAGSALVKVQTALVNEGKGDGALKVRTAVFDRDGKRVGLVDEPVTVAQGQEKEVAQSLRVGKPALWAPATPVLYKAVTQVLRGDQVIDEVVTRFGIRSLEWSAEKGLLLNGQSIKLVGGSVHHDNGPLGAAAFDRAEERRVELLKAAGNNAVRTSHNIPSPGFLDACDRLGLLVLDEPFDVWEAHKVKFDYGSDFDQDWKHDVDGMVMRDRNHPAVIIWGIGNEIPELTVAKGAGLAKQLVAEVRSLDTTRPLTLAFPGTTTAPTAEAVFSQVDITGYNYSLEKTYKQDHAALPHRLMMTTESFPAKMAELWEVSTAEPYVLGDFVWTAMDYLGESGIGAWSYATPEQAQMAAEISKTMMGTMTVDKMFEAMANGVDMQAMMAGQASDPKMKEMMATLMKGYPWHAADCGEMDMTGFRKPQSYYRDILWNGGDRVYATVKFPEPEGKKIVATMWATYPSLPSWTWVGQEGKNLEVEVYSGAEAMRLYLNGKLIGEKATGKSERAKAVFSVPYAPGALRYEGLRGGKVVAQGELRTTGAAVKLRLTADRRVLNADGQDLAFVTVEAVDAEGRLVQDAAQEVAFSLSGPGVIAAVGNGDGQDGDSYVGTQRKLFHGRAEVIVRTTHAGGALMLRASAPGLSEATAGLQAKGGAQVAEVR